MAEDFQDRQGQSPPRGSPRGFQHSGGRHETGGDGRKSEFLSSAQESEEIDIRALFLIFWRRRWLIISLVILGVIGSVYITSQIQPSYSARAFVLIETQKNVPSELGGFFRNFSVKDSVILSETQILKSRSFAVRVAKSLNLMDDPEFNPDLRQPGPLFDVIGTLERHFNNLLGEEDSRTDRSADIPANSSQDTNTKTINLMPDSRFRRLNPQPLSTDYARPGEDDLSTVVNKLVQAISVNIVPGSNVIYIEVNANSPRKSAQIANKYADLYLDERVRLKMEEAQRISKWLDGRLTELKAQAREAEKAVARHRVENNLVTTLRGEITGEQLTQLNSELIRAKGDLAAVEAKLGQLVKSDMSLKNALSSPDVLRSRTIQRLKEQEINLLRKRADLLTQYGNKHPAVVNIKNEIDVVQDKIYQEARIILDSIREEKLIAQARVRALEEGFNDLVQTRADENEAMIKLRELMMEAESSRAIYDKFLQTYKRSTNQEKLQDPEARVISYAPVPLKPSYPNKALFASLSATLMLFLGIALSLFLEKLDAAFKTVSRLEKITRFPCFGVIPDIRIRKRENTAATLWSKLSTHASENVRNLRTTLNLRGQMTGERPKVVAVTSSLPGEGKSTLATWLGLVASKSGEKVCLIDCDLRNPVLHKHLSGRGKNTLVEFLTKQAELEDIIHKDKKSGLYSIFAKPVPASALDLVSSNRMKMLIESLREEFDLVILDTPSCLSVSDPKILATLSDQTLYAVAWGQTERDQVMLGLKQFIDIGYYNLATVFSRVHLKNYAKLGYGEVGYDS